MRIPVLATVMVVLLLLVWAGSLVPAVPSPAVADPCDSHGECVSSSITFIRANPNHSLYLGDSFSVQLSITTGRNTTGYFVSWAYDQSVFQRSGNTFTVAGNMSGTFFVTATVTFTGSVKVGNTTQSFSSALTTSQSVSVIHLVMTFSTWLVNITDSQGYSLRNPDGTFYRNDSFCDAWNASFQFVSQRTDIRVNVTSITPPSLRILNYSADPLGRAGRFCYAVKMTSGYKPYQVVLEARALNWQGVSLALKGSSQSFALVPYNPKFTTYAYMLYRNSTAASSFERPWVLFVRYDGNLPGYSYAGDGNTAPFNGSRTLAERAFFSSFRFSTLSYQPFVTSGGVFDFHMVNSTGTVEYNWLNMNGSAPLQQGNRIEKYVFNATAPSLSTVLAQGFIYQNITMTGCWQRENTCNVRQNYWLMPFLWSGSVNIVSVGSGGNLIPSTPISLTIHNPSPVDVWLTANFKRVFGGDPQALKGFEADLYPTNQTMTFNGLGKLGLLLNQTSLVPPQISITVGGVSLAGNFTFAPVFVNSTIMSVPNSLMGTVFYANATLPFWSYNMVQDSLAYLPVATTIDHPSNFLELLDSSGWVAGNTTAPQTPSAFASQQYGFWPMGENLTLYANLQGGGINFLGTQKLGPGGYLATFYIQPWSGGISSVQVIEGSTALPPQSTLSSSAYPSPFPTALTGLYTMSYPGTGQDTKVVFTNIWGATTTIDLGSPSVASPMFSLIPVPAAAAFGVAFLVWFTVSGALKARRTGHHE